MRSTISAILLLALAACTESHTVRTAAAPSPVVATPPAAPALSAEGLAYVALPEDARYGAQRYL